MITGQPECVLLQAPVPVRCGWRQQPSSPAINTPVAESAKRAAPDESAKRAGKRLAVEFDPSGGSDSEEDDRTASSASNPSQLRQGREANKLPKTWAAGWAVRVRASAAAADEDEMDELSEAEQGDESESEEAQSERAAKSVKHFADSSKALDCACVCSAFQGLSMNYGCNHICQPAEP